MGLNYKTDADVFRSFAKKRGLRVTQKTVLINNRRELVSGKYAEQVAISGEVPPAIIFLSQGERFVHRAG